MAINPMSLLPVRPPVTALETSDRILLWCMREWLRAALAGEPVTLALKASLGGGAMGGAGSLADVAVPAVLFMDEAGAAWPERMRLHPSTCGCPISYDEWLLLGCLRDAGRNDRPAFDGRLKEMIGQDQRDRIWRAAARLSNAVGRASVY